MCNERPHRRNREHGDAAFQADMLQGVGRSFALTIAQLPHPLREVGRNVYLLCRIADTVEDDPVLSLAQKEAFLERWVAVVEGRTAAGPFALELAACLSSSPTDAERSLVAAAPRVVGITHGFGDPQRRAVERCVRIMARGMVDFQHRASPRGLQDLTHLDRYCYNVAGVVGETLTELFCAYSSDIDRRRDDLLALSASFGQGLQMVNILKDMWEDQRRGICWLPRDVFGDAGIDDLQALSAGRTDASFVAGLTRLVAITHHHLGNALRYILLLPVQETGIRRSCLWPLALAVLTLKRIHETPTFTNGREVKVGRSTVWAVAAVTSTLVRSNSALKLLFRGLSRGLPHAAPQG